MGKVITIPLKLLVLVVVVASLVWFGSCVYVLAKDMTNNPNDVPAVEKAGYSVKVINTGLKYYAQKVDDSGGIVTMTNYWQLVGDEYEYTKGDSPPLDRDVFGPIQVRQRR